MPYNRIPCMDVYGKLPEEWPLDSWPAVSMALRIRGQKVVVLDDDPTGTQTVYDVPVLTEWSTESLRAEMANSLPVFYILTNSRSLPPVQARELNLTISRNLVTVAREIDREFVIISRSDSTLRGHFPEEIDALIEGSEQEPDGILLVPCFIEGGRSTIDDIQYVKNGEFLVSANNTEFARDSSFGYTASNLRQWVEEKTRGRINASNVHSISIEDIRIGGPIRVAEKLRCLSHRTICVVNSATRKDLEVFTDGLLKVEQEGKRFLYRTASSFVQVRCGLSARTLLRAQDFQISRGGGLIIVGSFVPTTTAQLEALLSQSDMASVEFDITSVLDREKRQAEVERTMERANAILSAGHDVTIFTSRQFRSGRSSEESLSIGKRVSQAIVDVVRSISYRPRFIVAKGGITASDIATKALGIKRSIVMGQILPGISVWELGPESRYPGIPYIVFPGNVGDSNALVNVVQLLREVPVEQRSPDLMR